MVTRENERALIEHLARGDRNAFWLLWQEHHDHLRHLCLGLLRGHCDDVDDVLSETMLKAWEGLPRCAAEIRNLRAWLARVAYRVCMDWWRDRGRTVHYSDVLEETGAHAVTESQAPDDPQDLLLKREEYGQLVRVIGGLPPRLRDPLVLYVFQDKSYPEIASQLSISEANLRKRIQQAREALRQADPNVSIPSPAALRPAARRPNAGADIAPSLSGAPTGLGSNYVADIGDLAEEALARNPYEIRWREVELRLVRVELESGTVRDFPLVLDYKPARREVRLETIHRYLQRHPRGWRRRLELAQIHYASGQWNEAIAEYRRVLAQQPHLLESWLRLGEMLRLMHRFGEARQAYQDALKLSRRAATQHYLRGQLALCEQQYQQAAKEFGAAAAAEPANAIHWHALARAHLGAGQPQEALQAYDQALQLNPDDRVALLNSYSPLVTAGQLGEAQRRLGHALTMRPDCAIGLTLLANARCASGLAKGRDGQKTRRLIARALHLVPDSADPWAALAQFHIRRGEWEEGRAVLRDFTTRHPQCPQGWYHYSIWLAATGAYQEAAEAILTAHSLHPRSFPIAHWACAILSLTNRTADLQVMTERLLTCFPGRWDTYAAAGLALAGALGNPERGCEVAAQAPAQQSQLAAAWLLYGEVLALAQRYSEAVVALQRGWELFPQDGAGELAARGAFWLARCHMALGHEAPARECLQQLVHLLRQEGRPRVAEAHVWLGRALEALGDRRGAVEAYKAGAAAGVLYPEYEALQEGLARVQGAQGRHHDADPDLPARAICEVTIPAQPWTR